MGRISNTVETSYLRRPIPLGAIVLLTLLIYAPPLMMQLPLGTSYDANFHMFFASHYAQHWFNPWNEKWFAGFSQTTYPPLGHQWVALLSYVVGLKMGLMLVQLVAVVLTPIGVYRFARIWVSERASSYAALLTVFLGVMEFLVFSAGQLSTTLSLPLYLLAVPYFYHWCRSSDWRALLKGVFMTLTAASVHHVTLIFGSPMLILPVLWLVFIDRKEGSSTGALLTRALTFAVLTGVGVAIVLLPYWIAIIKHPIEQMPIPHASRSNLLLSLNYFINYFIVPYGALIVALPFIVWYGASNRRLRPLLLGFWVAFIFGLGGTTPLPKLLLGRAFEVLTFERFTLLAAALAMPIVGMLAERAIDRFGAKAAIGFAFAGVVTLSIPMAWLNLSPFHPTSGMNVDSIVSFLNRDGHDRYRYMTLGVGNALPKISTYTDAPSIDGEYNSARLLPEMTQYGSAQLTSSKYFGSAGMASLRAMLEHADHYGLKYIFLHDPYYRPLLAFAGWRQIETYDSGSIEVWAKDDVPPAKTVESDAMPAPWEGVLWGTLPIGCSFLSILLAFLLPDTRAFREPLIDYRAPAPDSVYVQGAH
jgi:hypothetical protein